ncbi:hypothetical protein EDD37DRAFT_260073 [Exophiala viscosa]|uniref:uncharacterized protein n=1 Tax=Exophiala viscosa TaxID=2486360 RepID=UPI0021936FA5|nr:hypothetical protein EDD37DRAFT_260073 [Exophiala viscosa]
MRQKLLEPRTLTVALGPEGRAVAAVAGTFVMVVQGNQVPGKGFGEKLTRSMHLHMRRPSSSYDTESMSRRLDLNVRRISARVNDRSFTVFLFPDDLVFRWRFTGICRGDDFLISSVGRHHSAATHTRANKGSLQEGCPQHTDLVDGTILNIVVCHKTTSDQLMMQRLYDKVVNRPRHSQLNMKEPRSNSGQKDGSLKKRHISTDLGGTPVISPTYRPARSAAAE